MMYRLENKDLAVEICSRGGELYSLRNAAGTEYLWSGDAEIWPYRAANMFPYVGRLTEGRYTYKGVSYPMDIHGFLKDMEMELREMSRTKAVLRLGSNETTRKIYPFDFELELGYELDGNCLRITGRIKNSGEETMYFGLGSHPGFRIPWDGKEAFEKHYLEFDEARTPVRVGMTEQCFTDRQKDAALELKEGKYLPLCHELFDRDAVYMEKTGQRVFLKRKDSSDALLLEFPDMRYLGVWHRPHTAARYICLEPFTSLPSGQDVVEAIEKQPDLVKLEAGGCYCNRWSVTIITEKRIGDSR